jgi:hypothetical protein
MSDRRISDKVSNTDCLVLTEGQGGFQMNATCINKKIEQLPTPGLGAISSILTAFKSVK